MSNWLDKFDDGGETPVNYNSIPTGIIKPPTVLPTSGQTYYDPAEQTIYLNPNLYSKDPSSYQHEMFHHWQNLNDQLRKPEEYQGPLAKPSMLETNPADYYNRRTIEQNNQYSKFYNSDPVFKLVNPNLIYSATINPSLYANPEYAEGEAEQYQNYIKGGGRPAFMANGGLIKRADGSYSRRGLWDNIRANRGSGRKPTAAMLEQERKIKKHEDGGANCRTGYYWNGTACVPFPSLKEMLLKYKEGADENKIELVDVSGVTSWDDAARGYDAWQKSGSTLPSLEQAMDMFSAIPVLGRAKTVEMGLKEAANATKGIPWGKIYQTVDYLRDEYNDKVKDKNKKADGGWIDMYNEGSWVTDSSLPQPTTPSFYPAYPDRTLTNYQMGTPKARMYGDGTKVYSVATQNTNQLGNKYQNTFQESSTNIDPSGNTSQQFIRQTNNPNQTPYIRYFNDDALGSELHLAGPNGNNLFIKPDTFMDNFLKARTNYMSGAMHKQGGPIMYREGATVWTKQNTPTWTAGTPTPTATQNFRNDRSLNTDLYRIGDVIPTGMNYKTPAAGTYDYNKDVQPYYKTILHAPDTTMMAKYGSHVTSAYKKRVGIPYAISPGVSDAGMHVGPTTQRGITFANGGWINKYEDAGPVTGGNNPGGRTDLTYDAKNNVYYKPLDDGTFYPVSQVTVNKDGVNKNVWTDSDEYRNMYGNLASYTYDAKTNEYIPQVNLKGVEVTAKAPDTYNNYILNKHKNDGLVGAMFSLPLDYAFGFPQAAATKFFTGKYQTPSEAMDIQNPYLATGVDMVLDPTNLVGAGLIGDTEKILNTGRLIGNGFRDVAQGVSRQAATDFRGMYNELSQIPRRLYNYGFRSNRNSGIKIGVDGNGNSIFMDRLPTLDNSALNTDELMARIRQNVADRNAGLPNSSTPPVYTPEQASLINLRERLNAGQPLSPADIQYLHFDSFGNPRPITFDNSGRVIFDFQAPYQGKPKVSLSNRSGLTKEEALSRAAEKDKDVISKMTEEEFANTVVKPNGEVVPYKPALEIDQVGYDAATRDTKLADAEHMHIDDYVKQFNDNIDQLNANIAKNNKSGVDYKVKELTSDGMLIFESPVLGHGGKNTTTTWGVRIKPGKWQGNVEDIANKDYYRTIPGLEITNSLQGLFADGVARRGTGIYGSLNDYLKSLGMGRIKPGFNSQTKYSRGLWEDAVKKGKAFGFYGGRDVVYGAMKKLGGPINKNTKKQTNEGWIEQYN